MNTYYRVFFGTGYPELCMPYNWCFSCMAKNAIQAFNIACEDCRKELNNFSGSVRVCASTNEKKVLYQTNITNKEMNQKRWKH